MEYRNIVFILCTCLSISRSQVTTGLLDNTIDSISPIPKGRNAKMSTEANRKPVFTDCDKYKPSVQEEQSAGTFVLKVTADDYDPKDAGGIVTYKIVKRDGERSYFNIDSVTGNITTTQPFDRDEPIRQKEMYITVQATDNGRPPLADICSFKVSVTDINDNSPSFDQNEYEARVSEDLKVNSEVMRVFAYDIDDGENSRLFYYFADNTSKMMDYFRIDRETGVVYLKHVLMGKKDTKFTNIVKVMDNGVNDPEGVKSSTAEISITVVSSDKQPPRFTKREPEGDIVLPENFNDFSKKLIYIEAESNADDPGVIFELIKGKTTQSNKDQTFLLIPDKNKNNSATISLVRQLDYETVTEYLLTVRIKNTAFMEATLNIPIKIEDVNDEVPTFFELLRGSVVENDEMGAQAMQVRAIDKDGTEANNIVSYELEDHQDIFAIDKNKGIITSKVSFDREKQDVYHVKVLVYDNSPSALVANSTEPNKNVQTFQISIEDQNDNKPLFTEPIYQFSNISEKADKGSVVGEVTAVDKDTASLITYSIISGNEQGHFSIENTTGRIRTATDNLDYETIEDYELIVRAFDGIFEDTAKVKITILNINDERPVFYDFEKIQRIQEEKLVPNCIVNVSAYDPDIKDRNADQHISFYVESKELTITKEGCLMLLKPLDRDPPYGTPSRQVFIIALDSDGGTNSLQSVAELTIILEDINDNAPFLNVTEIVWYENQPPDLITNLSADDYDGPDNGPPFKFRLADDTPDDIRNKFEIIGDSLHALVTFDREEQKYYDIPISITDSGVPPQTGTSILRVIIGDVNDNSAQDGESAIFVYKYVNGPDADIEVGRVFVEDLDDWDLPDKVFVQQNMFDLFTLNDSNKAMIYMKPNVEEGVYVVNYEVTESHPPQVETHTVKAVVNITVKVIIEEAVVKSGSIRMHGITKEEFIVKEKNGLSKKDILHQHLSKILNTSMANVDVFTVIQSPNKNDSYFDVRFSAHGSPYYAPERLQNKVTEHQEKLESELGVDFVMININECLNETVCGNITFSCTNILDISREPAVVFTNKTSFVGVNAVVDPVCDAIVTPTVECFNGGVMTSESTCNCPVGFQGPHCEVLGMGFKGDGWAMYPTFEASNSSEIILFVAPETDNGLIFYAGPLTARHAQLSKEFISLELKDGTPLLKMNFGKNTQEISTVNKKVKNDGALHKIRIFYTHANVWLEIDDCGSSCVKWTELNPNGILRLNGPLQLGGTKFVFGDEESKRIWPDYPPTTAKFSGCIRNLTYNKVFYNLGAPSDQYNSHPDCNYRVMQAVTFGIDSNFLVAILVCVAILIILLLAVVVHRRKQDNMNEKEFDDIRENIIDYGEDGGGECDTPYDLSVLRQPNVTNEKLLMRDNPDIPADISGLIDNKKDTCDKDPDNLPYDDVRHYAYEGDGNSTGSLSSLASCTDEGDLKFNYLSSFGPRFRKLADMYGEDPSDEDSHDGGEESWC